MLQLETTSAPVPKAGEVVAFCSHHGLQQETIIKAAWVHHMNAYFDCSVIFRLITVKNQRSQLMSSVVAGSEHRLYPRPRVVLESLMESDQD